MQILCPICYDELSLRPFFAFPCGHQSHVLCGENKIECPMCGIIVEVKKDNSMDIVYRKPEVKKDVESVMKEVGAYYTWLIEEKIPKMFHPRYLCIVISLTSPYIETYIFEQLLSNTLNSITQACASNLESEEESENSKEDTDVNVNIRICFKL